MSKARDIASAAPAPSTVSATELGYVDGVTSAIQTQIDSKIGSASAINPTIVDAKGDIIAATAADTVARLAVGTNGQVLTAASGQATGLQWATPAAGGGMTLLDTLTLSGASVTSTTFSSSYKQLVVYVKKAYGTSVGLWKMRMNGNTGSVYSYNYSYFAGSVSTDSANNTSFYRMGYLSDSTSASRKNYSITTITRPSDSDVVFINTTEDFGENPSTIFTGIGTGNFSNDTAPITSITLFPNTGTFSGGEAFIYGVN